MTALQLIRPTSSAPYAIRFVNDEFAIEYRFSLVKNGYEGIIKRRQYPATDRDLYSETFLSKWDTALRSVTGNEDKFEENARLAVEAWS